MLVSCEQAMAMMSTLPTGHVKIPTTVQPTVKRGTLRHCLPFWKKKRVSMYIAFITITLGEY